jgi:F0F1-type ATP synthase membrane subunit a
MKNYLKYALAAFIGLFAFPVMAQESGLQPDGIESVVKMIVDFLANSFPDIAGIALAALAGLVVLGRIYIAMSPTKKDDQWLQEQEAKPYVGMAFRVLAAFSPIQRKDK